MALINLKRLGYSLPGLLALPAKQGIVPGVGSRAIRSPDNTVQSMDFDCIGKLLWSDVSYDAAAGNSIPILYFLAGMHKQKPAGFLAGCKTCRHKPGVAPAFVAVAHGLRRMVFHPAGMEKINGFLRRRSITGRGEGKAALAVQGMKQEAFRQADIS